MRVNWIVSQPQEKLLLNAALHDHDFVIGAAHCRVTLLQRVIRRFNRRTGYAYKIVIVRQFVLYSGNTTSRFKVAQFCAFPRVSINFLRG